MEGRGWQRTVEWKEGFQLSAHFRRRPSFRAQLRETARALRGRRRPHGTTLPRRIMADVLGVAAFEVGDPNRRHRPGEIRRFLRVSVVAAPALAGDSLQF